ncbi:metallophosphoesterase [Pararhizobium mangrovi]|uniref:Metallophosphoesterase n=1 Tax=Pararhizobium mangrovi TaxID=2590452 RepID=A0A506U0X4_9HYPH|nr:metallophosphoesterase [Pararhizobium mangrovi]TPW27420.1 metallophosphoesterase [Pararhizobium mangrovi]
MGDTERLRKGEFPRRTVLKATASLALLPLATRPGNAASRKSTTFVFTCDVHACLMHSGLAPECAAEGKTDANLLRHVHAINALPDYAWPSEIHGRATGLVSAGKAIGKPRGVVVGGDMTDDGGGQVAVPGEGTQLQQFSHRYAQGTGEDQIHFPVYVGLGNHDLDQNGPPNNPDWYRRELRDYVKLNHRPSVFFKPALPASDYDDDSDDYAWDWGTLHLVQGERFFGDTSEGAINGLPWLKQNLAARAAHGRPVVVFQHYGWDPFSTLEWDPARDIFDDTGPGPARWWSRAQRKALLNALTGYNVIGIFHGHEHVTPMIYNVEGYDVFKPKAAFLGGFALVRVGGNFMDVVLAEARDGGEIEFTNAFSKPLRAFRGRSAQRI